MLLKRSLFAKSSKRVRTINRLRTSQISNEEDCLQFVQSQEPE